MITLVMEEIRVTIDNLLNTMDLKVSSQYAMIMTIESEE